jgi:hypothetical protein
MRLRRALRLAAYAWTAVNSLLGLAVGAVASLLGARLRVRHGALEVAGGRLGRWVAQLPAPFGFSAITFGHVILATDPAVLAAVRPHEHVHVRQYERWGPFFIPAYLLSSLLQLLRRRDPYLDNCFEREAYARDGLSRPHAAARPTRPPRRPLR